MPDSRKLFLQKLADLCSEYDAHIYYTTDDDGIHICIGGDDIDGEDVFVGFWFGDFSETLRKAALDLKDGD